MTPFYSIFRHIVAGLLFLSFNNTAAPMPPPGSDITDVQFKQWLEADAKLQDTKTHSEAYLNGLILSKSPYLLQHANNPINWQVWSDEVFSRAEKDNKLIFLSIGYSSCHWCHVMAVDSFGELDIALLLNRDYISVKVDREVHSSVDALYTKALSQVSGSAGWPITAILNAKGQAIFIDTFIPHNKLKLLLTRLANMWKSNPQYLNQNAANLMSLLTRQNSPAHTQRWQPQIIKTNQDRLVKRLDSQNGGLKGDVKFPSEGVLLFLLDQLKRFDLPRTQALVQLQMDNMAMRGLQDHVNGGFHRYTSDPQWIVPHYEKMLYNQGQLLMVYSRGVEQYGNAYYRKILRDTVSFIKQWMLIQKVGLASAVDADYLGAEGQFYLYSQLQLNTVDQSLAQIAGLKTYPFADSGLFGVYFEHSETAAAKAIAEQLRPRHKLRPHIDNKVITAWNALVIWGLAMAFDATNEKDYQNFAIEMADLLWRSHYRQGRLFRLSSAFAQGAAAKLQDYSYFGSALLALYDITGNQQWLDKSVILAKLTIEQFADPQLGFITGISLANPAISVKWSGTNDAELLPEVAVVTQWLHSLWLRTGDELFKQQRDGMIEGLKTQIVEKPLEHFYAAMVIQNIDQGSIEKRQYFANGNGRVTLQQGEHCNSTLQIVLNAGWHINTNKPLQSYLKPTQVTFDTEDVTARVNYPVGQIISSRLFGETLNVYQDQVELAFQTKASRLSLELQACSNKICLLPQKLNFYLAKCNKQ